MGELTFDDLIGKVMIIGITRKKHNGEIVGYEQYHGTVISADIKKGIVVRNENGKEYNIPPGLSYIKKANPGIYREKSTGVEIIDPDFITSWVVTEPEKKPVS